MPTTTFTVSPGTNVAAYSTIPLQVVDTDVSLYDYYNYLISIAWDQSEIVDMEPVLFGGEVWTKLLVSGSEFFKVGETILIKDMGPYSGLHNILHIFSNGEIVIDVTPTIPFTAIPTIAYQYHAINYRISPDALKEAKLDLSNTIKDFVSCKFQYVNDPYDAASTRFEYSIFAHSEFKWREDITNPTDNGGLVAVTIASSSLSTTPLQIGDKIKLSYDMVAAQYYDNAFSGGDLSFSYVSAKFPFLAGQTIFVTGQITEQDYNGETTVKGLASTETILITNKAFTTSTPQEGGIIYGHPRPEWNGVYVITDLEEVGSNLKVTVNCPWTTALPAGNTLYGSITFAEDVVLQSWFDATISDLNAFNAQQVGYSYNSEYMEDFVYHTTGATGTLSTIYNPGTSYRIEKTSKQFLLGHDCDKFSDFLVFEWYDAVDDLLGTTLFPLDDNRDTYFPIGIEQVLNSDTGQTDISVNPDDVVRYKVFPGNIGSPETQPYLFEVGHDCTSFDIWHLIWRDSHGSFIAYPFKSANIPSIEKESKSYYNDGFLDKFADGTFSDTGYGYGEKEYFSRSREKIELNTGWVNQSELVLIKDLFKSTQVLIQSPSGEIRSAKILDTSIPLNNELQDLIQYKLQVAYSTNKYNY